MKKLLILPAILFVLACSAHAQNDTTGKTKPDSVMVAPEKFKTDLTGEELQVLLDKIDEQISRLVARRQEIVAAAQKQLIKKPK